MLPYQLEEALAVSSVANAPNNNKESNHNGSVANAPNQWIFLGGVGGECFEAVRYLWLAVFSLGRGYHGRRGKCFPLYDD